MNRQRQGNVDFTWHFIGCQDYLAMIGILCLLLLSVPQPLSAAPDGSQEDHATITHGPILGRPNSDKMGIWVRTSGPTRFVVKCDPAPQGSMVRASGRTRLEHDNTGWTVVEGLEPATRYDYTVTLQESEAPNAWRDYLGWSNPFPDANRRPIRFGRAHIEAGSDILIDRAADFSSLEPEAVTNLHIHWNEDHPAAGVYAIREILGPSKLRISPTAPADGKDLTYSLGRYQYYSFQVANCEFFVLDTRSMRGLHDVDNPTKEGLSMLGSRQREWLIKAMRQSRAEFLFVVSSVNFSIPHVSPRNPEKDEAWTVFVDERERLFDVWNRLNKPVLLLTGDLHNSFAIRISDRIWEFASAPHNSGNHYMVHEGKRPPSGPFKYNAREVDIQWSSFFLSDVPRRQARRPFYCIVQLNNVFNNPSEGENPRWVAYPRPQAVIRFYDGLTGNLAYAQAVTATPER